MNNKTRTPQPDPRPESKGPGEDSPDQAGPQGGHYYGVRLQNYESRKRLARAGRVQGIDEELAILRWRLDELIAQEDKQKDKQEGKNHSLILKTIELIVRAYSAKARSSDDSDAPSQKGIENILRDASRKFGLKTIPWSSSR